MAKVRGDGHLSAIDIRSSKASPLAVSDDQEDELLSIARIKGDAKCVVGSGLGILSIWNRDKGWGDCKLQGFISLTLGVDRVPGHPASIDALVGLTPDVIASGSEDGLIRIMQILPQKFREQSRCPRLMPVGVIATHEYPIERMHLDRRGKWLGSVSHDECIKLTDVEDLFEESDEENEEVGKQATDEDETMDRDEMGSESENDEVPEQRSKEKRGGMGDMGRSEKRPDGFFDDL